jgi:hypothetical protein
LRPDEDGGRARVRGWLSFAAALAAVMLTSVEPARSAPIRIEGNFDLAGEARRDAHLEYDDRPLGYDRAFTRNSKRNPWDLEMFSPRAEFRAYAYPAPAIEIYAKVFQSNDFFLGEASTKFRFTRGQGDKENGLESYFFYRQGRLSLGDPILNISSDQFGNGIATSWWTGRGRFTVPKGRWSGEFNVQNFPDEVNASGEDNEAYTTKLRHEYRQNADISVANEFYLAQKIFTQTGAEIRRARGEVIGTAITANYKSTYVGMQYNLSQTQTLNYDAPDNDAFGAYLYNLIFIDRPKLGRVGLNANYTKWGRNYRNFLGRGPEFISFGEQIQSGVQTTIGDQVARDLYSEVWWEIPRYEANLSFRHQDKDALGRFRGRRLSRRNELDLNVKLIKNFDVRLLYNRTLFGLENNLLDYDAGRFIRDRNLVNQQAYASVRMNRLWGYVKSDLYNFRRRSSNFWITGLEGSYNVTPRLKLLARSAWVFIERPDLNWTTTNVSGDINGAKPRTSLVDPFFQRQSSFFQVQYRPTDNSQFFLEYGEGFHTDNDLSLDGDLLTPTRRHVPRVFFKLEMWF